MWLSPHLTKVGEAMRNNALRMAAVMSAVVIGAAACSGDSGGSGDSGPVKVGLLTSLSGPASAAFAGSESGLDARLEAYKAAGGKCSDLQFDVVTADDQSSPQGALAASQKLIQQDQVDVLTEVSAYFFGAAQYVTTGAKDTPTMGAAIDSSPQWLEGNNNLFAAAAKVPDFAKTYAAQGEYWKKLGVTKVAAVAYDNKASQSGMEARLRSADAAGIERAYVNDTLPLGSTDVGPIVLGIKNSGADALFLPINPDTAIAIVTGLRQAGVELKSVVASTGYGAELLESKPAVQAAQGMTFTTQTAPVEMATPATTAMSDAFKKYADNPSGIPSYSQSMGWLSGDLLIHALELVDCNVSSADFQSTLRNNTTWNGGGLLPYEVSFTDPAQTEECMYMVDLKGDAFVPQPDNSPICGKEISNS